MTAMPNYEAKNCLYMDLDSLYDTRMATLKIIDPKLALWAVEHGYTERVKDSFEPYMDRATFADLYARRDYDWLKQANLTRCIEIVANFLDEAAVRVEQTPFTSPIEIEINTWPYVLTKDEAQLLVGPVTKLCDGISKLTLINYSPQMLTPMYAKSKYSLMVMYTSYRDWLDMHLGNGNFSKTQIATVSLIVPELRLEDSTEEQVQEAIRQIGDPFRALENFLAPVVDINFAPIQHWCAYGTDLETYKSVSESFDKIIQNLMEKGQKTQHGQADK